MKLLAVALLAVALAPLLAAEAQPEGKVYRVGLLAVEAPTNPRTFPAPLLDALAELGYVEGKNLRVEARYAERKFERLAELASELVRSQVDAIVATTGPAIEAARRATRSIPIVMTHAEDPIGSGFIVSLARPGSNVTGTTIWSPETHQKLFEVLKEAFPQVRRVAVLWDPRLPAREAYRQATDAAAAALGMSLHYFWVETADDIDRALAEMQHHPPDAILAVPIGIIGARGPQIRTFLECARLPCITTWSGWVRLGGLMTYSWNDRDLQRLAATYVDRILRGARPGDLPVEQPRTYALVINLKTAKARGLTIPPSLLQRADELIQ